MRDFGLGVAFNRIARENYKGIESYTLTENPITNNRSAAMPSSQNAFNIDNYLERMRIEAFCCIIVIIILSCLLHSKMEIFMI